MRPNGPSRKTSPPTGMIDGMPTIPLRVLNRTLLQRQLLAERTTRSPLEVIRHLVAVQGQEPNWPYVGLWTRVAGFRHDDLAALLRERRVVRATMLRRTIHLAAPEDYRWLWPSVRPVVRAALRTARYAEQIAGLDPDEIGETADKLLAGRTLSRKELGRLLAEHYPGRHAGRLAEVAETVLSLVHAPAAGAWGGWSTRTGIQVTRLADWAGTTVHERPMLETMIERYLAAFGPAGVMDIQAWSGVTRLRDVVDGMRPRLRVLRAEDGRELFDLPDAALADPDLPAPVRFLPAFDNAVLGYRDRTRVIAEEDGRRFAEIASAGVPLFLVDGFAAGTWWLRRRTLLAVPFRPLPSAAEQAVEEEARRLLPFVFPGEEEATVAFAEEGSLPLNRLQIMMGRD
ncbi:Winged helix DNA-binding domain-containing protein [Thermostaphylospora chromogena]|uniref:Winged helix DNA-binding domain-containing protein n=2 Tax=Thermostaphylospora chromogena TaxID=35622 RepID=A0A1H1H2T8_9ACTN|nr:Winged helix DNA-binding domain-containing protein [Thermostaphylospora chromogena]